MLFTDLFISGKSISMRKPRGILLPANDTQTIVRASLVELRAKESAILSDIACGDTEERKAWQDLVLVRRSILACGGRGILRVA